MKKLRFVIFVMLIMGYAPDRAAFVAIALRAVRSAPEARVAVQMQKPPAAQEVFPYAGMDAQNRSSTTFSGGTSSSAGLCMNIFMYLNEEA